MSLRLVNMSFYAYVFLPEGALEGVLFRPEWKRKDFRAGIYKCVDKKLHFQAIVQIIPDYYGIYCP